MDRLNVIPWGGGGLGEGAGEEGGVRGRVLEKGRC